MRGQGAGADGSRRNCRRFGRYRDDTSSTSLGSSPKISSSTSFLAKPRANLRRMKVPYNRRLPMTMTTNTRQVGGVTIVDISGRIVLGEESAALRELVRDLLSKRHKKILLNLGDVNYIDSSGLGHLVSAFRSVQRQQGELKLLNLTNKVHDLMQITKLYTDFDIVDDEAVAVKSFGHSAAATG